MPFTMRQRLAWPVAQRAAAVLGMGVLLGFAAPFGSYPPLSAPVRYAFWIGMVAVGYGAAVAAGKLIPETSISRPELRVGIAAIASALPVTFVAAWAIPFVRPGHLYEPMQLPALFCVVAAVQLLIAFTLLRRSAAPARPRSVQNTETSPAFPRALLSRLPSRLGEEIVALEAADHYLRVHTLMGSDLVLMRLSDAIAAIEPGLGLQVHRSWWVARDAISEVVRSEQRTGLKLRNGLVAPVGRTYWATVRSLVAGLASDGPSAAPSRLARPAASGTAGSS